VRAVLVGEQGEEGTERTVESLEFIADKDVWRAELGSASDVPSALAAIERAPPAPKSVPEAPPPAAAPPPPPPGARKKRGYCCSCLPQRAQASGEMTHELACMPHSKPAADARSL
jgi:hypothetical protein